MSDTASLLEAIVVMAAAAVGLAVCVDGLAGQEAPFRTLAGLGLYLGVWAYCFLRLGGPAPQLQAAGQAEQHA